MNNLQFLGTKMTREGEVAYLLDLDARRVLRFYVEDWDGVEEDAIPPPPRRRGARVPASRTVLDPVVEDEIVDAPVVPQKGRSMPKAKSIMPPGMIGMFKPHDTPGADTEIRHV